MWAKLTNAIDAKSLSPLEARDLSTFLLDILSKRQIEEWLERQELSADAKALLAKIVDASFNVGTTVVSLGRKLLSTVASLATEFKGVAFGVIVGSVLVFLIDSIPLVGWFVGPILSPLLLAFGVTMGAIQDFSVMQGARQLELIRAEYEVLRT